MNRIVIIIVTLCCFVHFAVAQDRIVTAGGDTIYCKITRIGTKSIRFMIDHGTVTSRGSLSLSEVKTLIIDSSASNADIVHSGQNVADGFGKPAASTQSVVAGSILRIGFSGGPAYLSGSTKEAEKTMKSMGMKDSEVKSYFDQYKTGWQGNVSAHYFIWPGLAPGIHYRLFRTGASLFATFDPQDKVNIIYDYIEEDLYCHYVGLSMLASTALRNSEKWHLTSSLSAGIAYYRDEASLLSMNILSSGKAFGATMEAGLEYFVTRHISVHAGLNLFVSTIGKMTIDTGNGKTEMKLPKDERENMSAFDLSAGIRFYFN
jgi:hypothetical protein